MDFFLSPVAPYILAIIAVGLMSLLESSSSLLSNDIILSLNTLPSVACRLLSYGAKKEAKELLTHSASHSELMRSERGILALTAASVERDVSQFAWHIARRFCSQLSALQAPDGSVIPRDVS